MDDNQARFQVAVIGVALGTIGRVLVVHLVLAALSPSL